MVSPLLWQKIARGLSAGRVQSVAAKLVVEREKEIRAFVPEEYWEVHADLGTAKAATVRFEVTRENTQAFKPLNEKTAMAALEKLKAATYQLLKREDKPTSSKPSAPFITSTLQQAASTRLGFGVKKTMMMAQRLYEAGYITYMRTDSTNLSADSIEMVRGFIESEYGKKYLPAKPNVYSSKEGAQEAHEAIRPSDVNLRPTQISGMERDAERLYELIWRQFVACQMPPAEYLSTSVTVQAGDYELRAKGRILKFDGFTRVQPPQSKPGEDDVLPEMKMTPHAAWQQELAGNLEEVPLREMVDRISANMILPYPPGVPLVLPGEMVTKDSLPVLEFLEMLCEIGAHYPGFETDIHGLYRQADGSYTVKVLR